MGGGFPLASDGFRPTGGLVPIPLPFPLPAPPPLPPTPLLDCCSNILTRDVVAGTGITSVPLSPLDFPVACLKGSVSMPFRVQLFDLRRSDAPMLL
jgi:hypothetical protein